MSMVRYWGLLGASVLSALVVPSAWSARLGDPAVPVNVKAWLKGGPVDVRDGKRIYIVEFWATWCPPCRTSIPLLTELQRKYKDKLVIVGLSNEELEVVKPFVQQMGTNMDYVVAVDADGAPSNLGYMEAYGQTGIPQAFIVGRDGKVLWVGSPLLGLEQAVEQVLAGTYDLAAARKQDEPRAAQQEFQQFMAKGDPRTREAGRKLLADIGANPQALCNFAFGIITASTNRDFVLADEALDRATKIVGDKNDAVLAFRGLTRFESGKHEEGFSLVRQAVDLASNERNRSTFAYFLRVMDQRRQQQPQNPAPAPNPPPAPARPPAAPSSSSPPPSPAQGVPGKS